MINKISSVSFKTSTMLNKKSNKVSFGTAYGLGNDWRKTFNSAEEARFLNKISEIISNISVNIKKHSYFDGVGHVIKIGDSQITYQPGSSRLMSNLKYTLGSKDDTGIYIIDDGKIANKDIFNTLIEKLNNILGVEKKSKIIEFPNNNFWRRTSIRRAS